MKQYFQAYTVDGHSTKEKINEGYLLELDYTEDGLQNGLLWTESSQKKAAGITLIKKEDLLRVVSTEVQEFLKGTSSEDGQWITTEEGKKIFIPFDKDVTIKASGLAAKKMLQKIPRGLRTNIKSVKEESSTGRKLAGAGLLYVGAGIFSLAAVGNVSAKAATIFSGGRISPTLKYSLGILIGTIAGLAAILKGASMWRGKPIPQKVSKSINVNIITVRSFEENAALLETAIEEEGVWPIEFQESGLPLNVIAPLEICFYVGIPNKVAKDEFIKSYPKTFAAITGILESLEK